MAYVLIVDNDQLLRSVLADKLNQASIATQEAVDGQEGLDKARRDHPAAIVLDEHMPNMNGQQFVEELQKEEWFKETHIIVFTALHDVDLMNHKMIAGVSDYLDKSVSTPESLVETVKKYMPPTTAQSSNLSA